MFNNFLTRVAVTYTFDACNATGELPKYCTCGKGDHIHHPQVLIIDPMVNISTQLSLLSDGFLFCRIPRAKKNHAPYSSILRHAHHYPTSSGCPIAIFLLPRSRDHGRNQIPQGINLVHDRPHVPAKPLPPRAPPPSSTPPPLSPLLFAFLELLPQTPR